MQATAAYPFENVRVSFFNICTKHNTKKRLEAEAFQTFFAPERRKRCRMRM